MKIQKGFTLVELMIVVAIISILAAFAYPSYQKSVLRSHRADARVALQEAASRQERLYAETNTYSNDLTKLLTNADGTSSPEGFYTVTVNLSCSRTVSGLTYYTCFDLTATAKGSQAADTECATLTLAHTGKKGSTGGGTCW